MVSSMYRIGRDRHTRTPMLDSNVSDTHREMAHLQTYGDGNQSHV
jgi:hypothetical protein